MKLSRRTYADHYGPTTGDRIRLADTDLLIRIEHDFAVLRRRGEVRRRQGDPRRHGTVADGHARRRRARPGHHLGRHRRQHRHLQGRRRHSRRPHLGDRQERATRACMDGVTPGLEIGASTEILAGEGHILTAGGIDSHVHFISPNQIPDAFHSGITTLIGGGTGPATGTNATTCTPGAWNIRRMYEAVEAFPLNFGFLGKGNASTPEPLREQIRAGAHRPEAARGLGHDAGRDRQLSVGRRRVRRAGRDSHRHAERDRLRRGHHRGDQRPDDSHLSHRRRRRRPRARHHPAVRRSRTSCPRRRTRRCRSRGIRWTSTSTC